jgi:hypothetical protein
MENPIKRIIERLSVNRLMLARQGFASVAVLFHHALNEQVSDSAEEWLRNDVCPLAEDLMRKTEFRRRARWSLEYLDRGSESEERRLVDRVDQALVGYGSQLARAMREESARAANAGENESWRKANAADLSVAMLVASRPWFDLVCSDDFFHPSQELFLVQSSREHTQSFRSGRDLRVPLGDYVTRMLLARCDYWKTLLDRIFNQVFFRPHASGTSLEPARAELLSSQLELDQVSDRLVRACHQGDERLREASMTLIQVYSAYVRNPILDWLEFRPGLPQAISGMIRSCIRRRGEIVVVEPRDGQLWEQRREAASLCDPLVLRQIAGAIEDAAAFYEVPSDNRGLLLWALEQAKLVMVDFQPRAVHWNGEPVAEDSWSSHAREWDLLWALARKPGRVINQEMLMNADHHQIRSRRYRLGQLLGEGSQLDSLIENRRGQGYFLALNAGEVILLRAQDGGRLEIC